MAKNILFFADGTWNAPDQDDNHDGQPDPTNVVKLFGLLRGSDDVASMVLQHEQERVLIRDGQVLQVAKYLHGVGDSRNWLVRVLGGVFGAGVVARIARGYTFVSRHFEPGDRITLVGFSRGAYTVRALGGMIAAQGLLDRAKVDLDAREESYRLACAAWDHYREPRLERRQRGLFDSILRDMPAFVRGGSDEVAAKLTGPVKLQCVAVWDTVGALGVPTYDDQDARVDSFRFCDTRLNANVQHGYHAVAIDEMRADFAPTMWEPREGVTQVLFAGAHADVGGGYPMVGGESDLAHVALGWMRDRLLDEGVLMKDTLPQEYAASANGGSHRPWLEPVWLPRRRGPRGFADWRLRGIGLHESVVARMEAPGPFRLYPRDDLPRYRPDNIL